MRVAIVGSRDYPRKKDVVDYVNSLPDDAVVISGGARGVDKWAEDSARARGLEVEIFPADWDKHGKSAGFIRNADIVKAADRVVAFWDGVSRGTMHTVSLARQAGKKVKVKRSDEN